MRMQPITLIIILLLATTGALSENPTGGTVDPLPTHVNVGGVVPSLLYTWRDDRTVLLWENYAAHRSHYRLVSMDLLSARREPMPALDRIMGQASRGGVTFDGHAGAWIEGAGSAAPTAMIVADLDTALTRQVKLTEDCRWTRPVWVMSEASQPQSNRHAGETRADAVTFGTKIFSQSGHRSVFMIRSSATKTQERELSIAEARMFSECNYALGATGSNRVVVTDMGANDASGRKVSLCSLDPYSLPIQVSKTTCALPRGARLWSMALAPHKNIVAWLLRFNESKPTGADKTRFEVWLSTLGDNQLALIKGISIRPQPLPFPIAFQWSPDGSHLSLLQGDDLQIFSPGTPQLSPQ